MDWLLAFILGGVMGTVTGALLLWQLYAKPTQAALQQTKQQQADQLQTLAIQLATCEQAKSQLESQAGKLESLYAAEISEHKSTSQGLQNRLERLQIDRATLETELDTLKAQHQEWRTSLEQQWQQQFESFVLKQLDASKQNLEEKADKEYQEKQSAFEVKIQDLLKPLTETIEQYKKEFAEIDKDRHAQAFAVLKEVQALKEINGNLSAALSHNKGRGDWGELELMRLLEDSGLTEGVGYLKQAAYGEERKRPDIKILLPDGRCFFIDAKAIQVDLNDFPSPDETLEAQNARHQRYAKSLKNAVELLSSKEYQKLIQDTADFVVLYVPRESMMAQALTADPTLFEWAFNKQVILSGPFNLAAMLKVIHHSWVMAKLSDHAEKILDLGTDLQKQAVLFAERFAKMSGSLDTLNRQYQETWTAFQGNRGFIKQIQKLEEYGCKSTKAMPEDLPVPEIMPLIKA